VGGSSPSASEKVTVAETLPTVAINKINGNNVITVLGANGGDCHLPIFV
jgi:hypothetical protein